ncbi:hypothetical protein GR702_16890 [Novosphingobium sp. FGD1]|uniref:Uncharacterized protein n=1 Tax=Novosphingobium silvae TaxID=2692619 RepID=A0A7X4GIU6_9SPHN|nr:hypothetical protein [Novosphingobium silvae]MYL99448.1 hypothetical protein [Novosphingobium silvae]
MGKLSVGPDSSSASSGQEGQAGTGSVDAQGATEADMDSGIAGAEAKPFASTPANEGHATPSTAPGVAKAKPEDDLISGRRNAGRDPATS